MTARRLRLAAAAAVVAVPLVGAPGHASPVHAAAATAHVAAPSPAYAAARSWPQADSYYPAEGEPGVDALHYGLDLTWDDAARRLVGTADILLRTTRAEATLRLDLGRPLHVKAVTVDGAAVTFAHRHNNLVVHAAARLARHTRHRLVVRYAGSPRPVRAPVTRGDFSTVGWTTLSDGQVWTMQEPFGAFTWYPVSDQPSDKAFYDVTVHTRSDWNAVSNGRLVADRVTGGTRTMHWRLASPAASYLVTIAIGPYRRHGDTGPHGLPVTYWVRPAERSQLGVLRRTPAMLRWLEARLGRFPFDRIGVVVVPSFSAMETQTMVTMGNTVLTRQGGAADLLHELSHQWYGDVVTPRQWKDVWLNESFAMYIQIRWEVAHHYASMHDWRRILVANDQSLRDDYGPPGAYDKGQFASTNVYYCGALMLDRLHHRLGAKVFGRVLRGWPAQHRLGNADRFDWIRWLDRTSRRHLDHFVHVWLMSKRSPA